MKYIAILTLFLVALCTPNYTDAQVCNIKGTYDTVEVAYDSYDAATNKLTVSVNSDSQQAANITITATVNYKNGNVTKTQTYTERVIAQPCTSSICEITVPSSVTISNWKYTFSDYTLSISGNKCE